ncbi:hypothetical protein AGOR_G00114250 [Albula goreensis]|uniref:L-fucose mutarotase n=1 Tax=Albula goreensis TaxID=1534307 RepID=A0A8T3DIY1_9TELE|nr:hypothetical protein AGOR_G00114250 [Albula goreensis]
MNWFLLMQTFQPHQFADAVQLNHTKAVSLDTYVDKPAAVMDLVESDKESGLAVPVWETYSRLLKEAGSDKPLEKVERFAFYERAKKAFAVMATGETSLYGNLIIKKGVIAVEDRC